jgi:hypothetical protein
VADLALITPADAAGNVINLAQTPAQALVSMNCTLIAPANPLTAVGLATPWQLSDGCTMANFATLGGFVEATILAPNGTLQVYNPLVITAGTTAATTPIPPTIAAGSQVIINTGFNGNALVLQGAGATQGLCIDAFGQSIMNQTAACNATAFYADANAQIAAGTLTIPLAGTDGQGAACETTSSFSLIDQDQSDNVVTAYLLDGNGLTAQDTAANVAAMAGSTKITNGSDDALLAEFVDPALGCTPFTAPDTTAAAGTSGSQALNDLSAAKNQLTTPALNPVNDPQLLVAGAFSLGKTNAYRVLQDQPPLAATTVPTQNAATYCQNMVNIQPAKLKLDMGMESVFGSPVAAIGNNLANFLAGRLFASFANLNCQNFGLVNPVTLMTNGGIAVGATFNLNPQTAVLPVTGTGTTGTGVTPTPTATATTVCVPAEMNHHHRVAPHCVTTSTATHHRGSAGNGFRGRGSSVNDWGNFLTGGRMHT